MSEKIALVPMPMPVDAHLLETPWAYTNFSTESTMHVQELPFEGEQEFWAAPCVFDNNTGMHGDTWQAMWRQQDAIVVTSMEQAKMAKLLHKWKHMILIRVTQVQRVYTFIWWCDAFPRMAHKVSAGAAQFAEISDRWCSTPKRWI